MKAAYIVETPTGFSAYDCWTKRRISSSAYKDYLVDDLGYDKYKIVEDFATFRLNPAFLTLVYYDAEQDKWLSFVRNNTDSTDPAGLTFDTFKDAKKFLEQEGWHLAITNMQKVSVIERTSLTTLTAEYEDLKHQLHEKAAEIINCLNRDEHGC